MLEKFSHTFGAPTPPLERQGASLVPSSAEEFTSSFGGRSWGGGLYRVAAPERMSFHNGLVSEMFPDHAGTFTCFAFDWAGRHYATDDERRSPAGDPLLLLFVPGEAEAYEMDLTLGDFHDGLAAEDPDGALAREYFEEWRSTSGVTELAQDECVGYKVPLFVNGDDEIENLALTDLAVYWSLSAQLWMQVKDLPDGTPIRSVTIIPE
jgi:hypothetical protein